MTQDDPTRALPHALGPEKSLLSSMLQYPQEYVGLAIEEKLTKDHFYIPAHSTLFEFLVRLFVAGEEIEIVSLIQRLLDNGLLDRVGGPGNLSDLYTYAPSPGHFHHHLNHVKTKFMGREIIRISHSAIADVYDSPDEIPETLEATEKAILGIRDGLTAVRDTTLGQSVQAVMEAFQREINRDPTVKGLQTGNSEFDRMSGGLKPGEMTVVGARPSMGKTALMLNWAEAIAVDANVPGLVFSAEMSKDACVRRMVFSRARFALSQLSRGYDPNKGDLLRIQRASAEVGKSPLLIDDKSSPTIAYIVAKARRLQRDKGIKFLMLDYLQLFRSGSKQAQFSREREIAEISAGLKALAKDLGIAVVVLAQLNRDVDKRATKAKAGQPRMSDLRESGAIEQDADLVGLLHRADYGLETDEEKAEVAGRASLILAKNRNGETGNIPLTWIAELMRFEDGQPFTGHPRETPKNRWSDDE